MRIKHGIFNFLALLMVVSLSACLMPTRVASFPTATPYPTDELPAPTETLVPTATVLIETPTPAPTATQPLPQPSPTPTSTVSVATEAAPQVTDTPAPTETPQPTSTPSVPMISAWMDTNCRLGPDPVYDIVGALVVGEKVELKGRSVPGGWWYIENPEFPGRYCWVWGITTEIEGDTASLRVVAPPASPTPTR